MQEMKTTLFADRLSGILCLAFGAWLHVTDQYIHIIGNEIISAGHIAHKGGGSWNLLNALMFSRPKSWMILFLVLGTFLFVKSLVAEFRQNPKKEA